MNKTILLSLLLIQSITSQCAKGCLRCTTKSETDSTKVCHLCDSLSSYYRKDDGSCALSDLKNCMWIKHDNTCGYCNSGHFIGSGKCVAVDVANKITNCEYSDSNQRCATCLKNYLISTTSSPVTCTKINAPLANCMVHTSATVCQTCDLNYYKAEDGSCKAFPTGCLGYSLT